MTDGPRRELTVQESLARILRDAVSFAYLLEGRHDALAERHAMSQASAESIRSVNLTGIWRFRRTLQEKHLRHAEAALPSSMAAVLSLQDRDLVLEHFWADWPLPADPAADLLTRYVRCTTDFISRTPLPVPAWLRDTARYEGFLVDIKLGGSCAASTIRMAGDCLGNLAIRRCARVRLAAFDRDVTSVLPQLPGLAAGAVPPVRTYVVGHQVDAKIEVRKVGPAGYAALQHSASPQTVGTLVADIAAEVPAAAPASIARFVMASLRNRLMVPAAEVR